MVMAKTDLWQQLLVFIEQNLHTELDTSLLASRVHLSKWHFQRQFKQQYQQSVGQYIRALRLAKASARLQYRSDAIHQLAGHCGFLSSEGFSRSFLQHSGMAPSEFRRQTAQLPPGQSLLPAGVTDPEWLWLEPLTVALLNHHGSMQQLGSTIQQFIQWRKQNKLPPTVSRTFNLWWQDPATASTDRSPFALAAELSRAPAQQLQPLQSYQLFGGSYLRLRLTGPEQHY